MARDDLLSIIKTKQAVIAKLQTELEEARSLPAAFVRSTTAAPQRDARRRHPRRRSVKMLEHSPTAHEAAKVLRVAGRPLHATAIAKLMKRKGRGVTIGTLVSTLSRWVQSRSVFSTAFVQTSSVSFSQRRGSRKAQR